jgi:hypothetical protein
MTRGDQIRAYIHGLSELLEQVDHDDMRVYLKQDRDDELTEVRRLHEVYAQERGIDSWEN